MRHRLAGAAVGIGAVIATTAGGAAAHPAAGFAGRHVIPRQLASRDQPQLAPDTSLESVAMDGSSDGWAVGYLSPVFNPADQSFIEHFDGTGWSRVASPNPGGKYGTDLDEVAVSGPDDAWAVGSYRLDKQADTAPLILHWDGSTWSIVDSPSLSGGLQALTVVSPNDVWAAGEQTQGTKWLTLTEHWDGTSWAQVPCPSPPTHRYGESAILSLAAVDASDVWGVGTSGDAAHGSDLVEHWDGTSWTVVPSPDPGPGTSGFGLIGVSALGSDDVYAAGSWSTGEGSDGKGYVLHWNGSTWRTVFRSGLPKSAISSLDGIAAISDQDVWAVGFDDVRPGRSYIVHWDGSTWKRFASPHPGDSASLTSISAIDASDIWAVGQTFPQAGQRALRAHWDGTRWSRG